MYIYRKPPPQEECDSRSLRRWSNTGLETSILTKVIEQSLPYTLVIAKKKADGYISFPRRFAQNYLIIGSVMR